MNDLNSTSPPPSEAQNIMSFLTTATTTTSTTPGSSAFAAKHIIRQEGFHPSSPGTPPPPPGSSSGSATGGYELFNSFLPDPFRRMPGTNGPPDFTDELASLMQQDNRSSSSSNGSGGGDRFSRTHNIFDISAPTANGNNPSSNNDYPTHFNQTLPALNSSLRYEPDPASQQQQPQHQPPPPPSSFHHPFTRHTPSPTSLSSSLPHTTTSRSRSRSRPPSGGDQSANTTSGSAGGIGPARTTRSRRNNSVSGTSPPPGRPHAIVIPRSRAATVSGGPPGVAHHNQWFMPGHSATSEYSLPTPESLASPILSHAHSNHSHSQPLHSPAHHLAHSMTHGSPPLSHSPINHHTSNANGQQQHPYSSFSLSPPPEPSSAVHLPPVSSLSHQHNQNSSFGVIGTSPGSPNSLPTIHSNMHNMHSGMHHNANMAMGASSGIMNGGGGHHHSNSIGHGHGHGHTSSVGSTSAFNISNLANGLPQSTSGAAPNPLSPAEKQAAIANEKRRRRRESHNAVERRRRDNINEKISELATLIPECMLDPATTGSATSPIATVNPSSPILPGTSLANANASDDAASPGGAGSDSNNNPTGQQASGEASSTSNAMVNGTTTGPGGVMKANKGMILRKSVEYIRYLQQLVEAQGARNRHLEAELKSWREGGGGKVTPPPLGVGDGHGGLNINTNMGAAQWGSYQSGWLPSMPEGGENEEDGDDQDGDDVDMDQDSDEGEQPPQRKRGATRGRAVSTGKKGGSKKKVNGAMVKEEMSHGGEGDMMVM